MGSKFHDRYAVIAEPGTPEIAHMIGVSYRQLDYWCRLGYIGVDSQGSGHPRAWTGSQVATAKRMARLVTAGLTPAAAARVACGDPELAPGIRVEVADA